MKRFIIGFVWCVVMYFAACAIIGALAGSIAAANLQPGQNSFVVGQEAGARAVEGKRLLILLGSVLFVIAGAYFKFLPGTYLKEAQVLLDEQRDERKRVKLSTGTQFFIVLAAALGTLYGLSRGNRESFVGGAIGCGLVVLIVAFFLFLKRKKG